MRGSKPSTVGMTGRRKYGVIGLCVCGPMTLAVRSIVDADVGTPAGEPAHVGLDLEGVLGVARAGRRLGFMSSVNIAGSRLLAPYTVVVDFTTMCRRPGAFWQAASSCMVPMTLSSFIVVRPPALPGVAITLMWTTVSTSSLAMTLAITGLRMSARTKVTSPMSSRGGTTSTPMTRSTAGSAASGARTDGRGLGRPR